VHVLRKSSYKKKMKKGTFLWILVIAIFTAILVVPSSREIFIALTKSHPYMMGFIKFAILATMGELLVIRITSGNWGFPKGIYSKAFVWGVLGMLITLIFQIFGGGVTAAMASGYLPGGENKLAFAFLVASIMNLTFAPSFMAFHRCTDTYIDMMTEGKKNIQLLDVTSRIDWNGFVSFVVVKTIPFFWIPAHTITFLLPPEFRIIAAAFLSIALGIILSFAKKKSKSK
jgi:hypothetical protein